MYTGTGDRGETSLYDGRRVGKETARIEAYGTVDELNSQIGFVRALLRGNGPTDNEKSSMDDVLRMVQRDLFVMGGDLASEKGKSPDTIPRIEKSHVKELENRIDKVNSGLERLKHFILPGGGRVGSSLHVARAVCRRAERRVVALSKLEPVNEEIIRYLNRLSTLLFDLARLVNKADRHVEEEWSR